MNLLILIGENTLCEMHEDDHFAKAQVKYLMTYLTHNKQTSLLISMDDKAKIKIGIPCVSHHVKSRRYFL